MKYLTSFMKLCGIQLEDYPQYVRQTDGYINVGKICSLHGKQFAHWLESSRTKKFLNDLEPLFKKRGITTPLYTKVRKENKQGTYAHPLVAINIAQWISPRFEISIATLVYELFLTGEQVDIQIDTIEQIDNERISQVKHENSDSLDFKHKFHAGNCFYIVQDIDCKYEMFKFGQSNNFAKRISSLRNTTPRMLVKRLIYIENHIEFENYIKQFLKANNYLKFVQREYVDIPLQQLNQVVDLLISELKYNVYEIDTTILDCVNKKYLNCISTKNIDKIFNYIEEMSDINVEQITNKLQIIDEQFKQYSEQKIQKTQNNESDIIQTIQVNRITTIDDFVIQDFEHEFPLKRRVRKSDFDFLIEQVNLKYARDTHKWFILQFIFHVCYYTGVAPRKLILMTRKDMVNYINGIPIKIDSYNLFTNNFIKEKFAFLLPYTNNLLPGGMVNQYGGKLTYRQLCKWTRTYFEKLEQNNFGKILTNDDGYRLYDFKTILLFRLYNSGMAISDISTFLHHKNICTTQNHLKDHKFLYDETFQLPKD